MKHVIKRGNVYWFRMRCPERYRDVFTQSHVSESLKTDSKSEAEALAPQVKQRWLRELEARISGEQAPHSKQAFKAMVELANSHGLRPATAAELAAGDLDALLSRVSAVEKKDPNGQSALFAAALGGFEPPETFVSEVAENMPEYLPTHVQNKNGRQKRTWENRYKRASKAFAKAVRDKPIIQVSRDDAYTFRRYWENRVNTEEISTAYAHKHIGYLRAMVDAFFGHLQIDEYINPFNALSPIAKPNWERLAQERQKPEFSPRWIKETILSSDKLSGLNQQARDVLIVCAETGCRQTEIYDLPASSIRLDEDIPHLSIQLETVDEDKREIKNRASNRKVPLLGAALEAIKRNPAGFPIYRGNGNFSNTVAKYFKTKNLLPTHDHQVSGLRHSYETRMRIAGIDNEERGFLMGHSTKKMRGREVYGEKTKLEIQALLMELIVFPTETWMPRPPATVHSLIDQMLEEEGYRTRKTSS